MKKYTLFNNCIGWLIFIFASFVYLSTIEPTASFWDCGEFISSAYKLEVGHPPGAPFFMLIGRMFSMFAGNDPAQVAKMINSLSALASAFTILFLFWTITHLAKKIMINNAEYSTGKIIAIMGSGLVGALSYTFSDTFWFSAVEGEVYATSSLFTAIVFWAILKWENVSEKQFSNRWIILIAYLMGVSIGIHLLNLLAIPAIVLVYYFKKYKFSTEGLLKALFISVILLGSTMYILIPGVIKIAAAFELLFVNSFGMPYWSGVFFYLIVLIALLAWSIYSTYKKKLIIYNTILVSITVILIGYSSYSIIVIRSLANPPMDQDNPEHIFSLLRYLNREQYGDRPLFYGQYFNAVPERSEEGSPVYTPINGKYKITSHKLNYIYDKRFKTLFPRMWSSSENHPDAYIRWAKIDEKDIYEIRRDKEGNPIRDREGNIVYDRSKPKKSPTFVQNLRFLFRYQLGHMYFRYLMWNFSGRQNDIQSHYKEEITQGNWISGIKFIDEIRLGNQDDLPESMLNNKARNKYYMLPLLLGLIGLVYHYKQHKKDFWATFALFFMTGIAIVLYLNQNPIQPRERDYTFAGSFYAYSIWIGLGVLSIIKLMNRFLPHLPSTLLSIVICIFAVPVIMANENWDDHDRSDRYFARDFAYNYLHSCAKNAILFTNGDNDTFPLWYAQEVEGIRTDVRVINLSYLSADWYIEQMQRKVYDSDPVPFSMKKDKYIQGTRDVVQLFEIIRGYTDLKQAIDFLADDNPRTKQLPNMRNNIDFLPNKRFSIPVDSAKVLRNGTVSPKFANKIVHEVKWKINNSYLLKNHMMVLDLLATNNWERPVYYAITVSSDNYLNLEKYFQIQGLAYRIVPVESSSSYPNLGGIDTDIMFENMINKFKWGGIPNKNIYLDENILRMLSNFRNNFSRLADGLIEEGKIDSAKIVLEKCLSIMPDEIIPFNIFNLSMIESYLKLNEREKALEIAQKLKDHAFNELDYLVSLEQKYDNILIYEKRLNMHILNELITISREYGFDDLRTEIEPRFQNYAVALNFVLR